MPTGLTRLQVTDAARSAEAVKKAAEAGEVLPTVGQVRLVGVGTQQGQGARLVQVLGNACVLAELQWVCAQAANIRGSCARIHFHLSCLRPCAMPSSCLTSLHLPLRSSAAALASFINIRSRHPPLPAQDVRLDNRFIDLRTPANQAIFRVQSAVCQVGRWVGMGGNRRVLVQGVV